MPGQAPRHRTASEPVPALGLGLALRLGLAGLLPLAGACSTSDTLPGVPRVAHRASVLAGGRQLTQHGRVGQPVRAHISVANDGDQPVLLLGATPQKASDDLVTLIERAPGVAVYDATAGSLAIERARFPGESVAVHYGLLLPGESMQLYTTVHPVETGWTAHDYRLDYLTAPWETLRQHLYLAGPVSGSGGRRTFQQHGEVPADLAVPRLRRAILADGHDRLERGAVRFRVVLGPVEQAPLPLGEAYRLAGLEPGVRLTYSDLLAAWAFEGPEGAVLVRSEAPRGERFELKGVTLAALRALDRHSGAVPIVFADVDSYEVLRELIEAPSASAAALAAAPAPGEPLPPPPGPDAAVTAASAVVPRDRLLALLALVGRTSVTLDTLVPAFTLAAKDPGASPLYARR